MQQKTMDHLALFHLCHAHVLHLQALPGRAAFSILYELCHRQVAADAGGAAEPVDAFWERCGRAWSSLQAAAHEGGGRTVAVVTHSSVISGILCRCLEMRPADLSLFRTGGGSITLIGFPGECSGGCLRACLEVHDCGPVYTRHEDGTSTCSCT